LRIKRLKKTDLTTLKKFSNLKKAETILELTINDKHLQQHSKSKSRKREVTRYSS
jgi:hypothetical protein